MTDRRDRTPILRSSLKAQAAVISGGHCSDEDTEILADTNARQGPHFHFWWMFILVTLTILGLVLIDLSDWATRNEYKYSPAATVFFVGLFAIFVPICIRVLMRDVHRRERLSLVIILGIALYAVKYLSSPSYFTFGDEYIHLRSTQNILQSGHLFGYNPLLPAASYYPGLAAAAAALISLTGLSPFVAGLLMIGMARILICSCYYLIAEKVTGSSRVAGAASVIYAANPDFLFWSSYFSYENLALPLAMFVIWWLGRTRRESSILISGITVVAIAAVVVIHHVTGFVLAALLGVWWLVDRLLYSSGKSRGLGLAAIVAASVTLAWFLFVARSAASYLLDQNFRPALDQLSSLASGKTPVRHPYSGGPVSPVWWILSGYAAVLVLMAALPLALYRAWCLSFRRRGTATSRYLSSAPMVIIMGAAAAFPFTLIPRLTPAGGAVSARTSEFIFTSLGCVLGLLIEEIPLLRRHKNQPSVQRGLPDWCRTLVAAGLVTFVFFGEMSVGSVYSHFLPESAHPAGYPLTVQPDVIAASIWAREHLGIHQRFGASFIDSEALATYGDQDTVDDNDAWPIFFSSSINTTVVDTMRATGVHYILVDWRMTWSRPLNTGNYYFSPWEPGAGKGGKPFPSADLQKFIHDTCIRLVYSAGVIQILDVSPVKEGACVLSQKRSPHHRSASS